MRRLKLLVAEIILFVNLMSHIELSYAIASPSSSPPLGEASSLRYFYTDNSEVQQSVAFKYLQEQEQKELQDEILNVLGLDHRPKPKKHVLDQSAPKYLMDLYTSFLDQETGDLKIDPYSGKLKFDDGLLSNRSLIDLEQSDLIMSFVNQIKTQRANKHLRHHRDRRFWFNISDVPSDAVVFDAELRLYRDLKRSRLNDSYGLELTLYELSYGLSRDEVIMNFVDSLKINGDISGWIRFNVTGSFSNWIKFPTQNLGLYLQIRSDAYAKDLSPKTVGLINSRGMKKYQPFMTAYIKSTTSTIISRPGGSKSPGRNKRATNKKRADVSYYDHDEMNPFLNSHDRYTSGRSCQKRTLYVSFRDLNWQDWIIAPDGYAAFFCDGDCSFPMNVHMNATNHAIVQHLIHIMNPYNVPKPCCAPTQLSAIMVLYFDDNSNVVLKKFKNMVVKSCGCH